MVRRKMQLLSTFKLSAVVFLMVGILRMCGCDFLLLCWDTKILVGPMDLMLQRRDFNQVKSPESMAMSLILIEGLMKVNMDIDEGNNSEESDGEAQEKKMEVLVINCSIVTYYICNGVLLSVHIFYNFSILFSAPQMDSASNAQERDLKNVGNDSSSDSIDDDDDDDDDGSDVVEKPMINLKYSEEELEEKDSKTTQEFPKMLVALKEQNAASKTIYTKNLSYSVEQADLENLFKECGEIVDVRLHTDHEGRFKGFGHVEFATTEAAQKALQLNNTELLRRPIRIGIAQERDKYNPNRSYWSNPFQKCERIQHIKVTESLEYCEEEIEGKAFESPWERPKTVATWKDQNATSKTIYARNLSYSVERADIEILFKECGEIVDVRLQTDHEGRFRGFGHIEFATTEAAQKALDLDNTELLRRRIRVGIAPEKGEYTSNRSNWSNSFQKSERIQPIKGRESSEYCEEEIEGKASKSHWESPKLLQWNGQNASSKTIYVRNLSYRVERADMENLFEGCGEIVDVRLHTDHEGRFDGFGHVEFASADAVQKALEFNNTEFLRRRIRVGIAQERGEHMRNRSNWSNSFQKSERIQPIKGTESSGYSEEEIEGKTSRSRWEHSKMLATWKEQNSSMKTIYVRNLSYRVVRADMENFFKECGEIVDVRLHTNHEGRLNGIGCVVFATAEAVQKALELDNTEFLRRRVRIAIAREKGEHTHRSNWSHSSQKSEQIHPIKDTGSSVYCEEEGKTSKSHCQCPKMHKWNEPNASSKTIYVRNLSYRVQRVDMENLFEDCGEIVDVRLHTDHEGRLNGFGHVEFATGEALQKALELDNREFLRRRIRVGIAREKGENTHKRSFSNWSNSFQKSESSQPMKGSEHLEDCHEEFEEKASKAPLKSPKTLATPTEENVASKTIFVGNLSYGVEQADMENLFKECGEIVDVRLHTDHEGRSKGFGHVEFGTAKEAQKALELDNTELLRRPISVKLARGKGEYTCNRSNWHNSFEKSERIQSLTVFVKGFDTSLAEEEIKASLEEHFHSCGELTKISIPTFRESGAVKGFAHLDFKDIDSVKKALHLDQAELGGYPLSVEKAKPRRDNHGIGSGRGGGDLGERDGSGYSGRAGWGISGCSGWHSSFY